MNCFHQLLDAKRTSQLLNDMEDISMTQQMGGGIVVVVVVRVHPSRTEVFDDGVKVITLNNFVLI